jgi:gluconokinase
MDTAHPLCLVLESSTASAKAMLYDLQTGRYRVEIEEYPQMGTGGGQDPDVVLATLCRVGRKVRGDQRNVAVIALGCTWHSILLCDRDMRPVTPVYQWTYTGAADLCRDLRKDDAFVDRYYRTTGCMVNATYPYFKLRHLKARGVDPATHLVSDQGSYNFHQLTGKFTTTECVASGTGLLDITRKEFDAQLLDDLGITTDNLGQLVPYDRSCPLTPAGAALLDLPSGIPVLPANSDGGLTQIGSGALRDGVMTLSVGTSGAMRLTTAAPLLSPRHDTWCYLAPRGWLSGAATAGACNCLDWFRHSMNATPPSYQDLEQGIRDRVNTPIFLPFLAGERCPGWDDQRTGGFTGLTSSHTYHDMYRGVLEGVLFNLYQCYGSIVQLNGEPEAVMLSGGILKSPFWTQMCADVFGRALVSCHAEQSSLLGGAMLCAEQAGVLPRPQNYQPPIGTLIHPDPEATTAYAAKFARYLQAYRQSSPSLAC